MPASSSKIFGNAHVTNDPRETGDEPCRLDPPDRVDGAMCIGSCHYYRSHHLPFRPCKPSAARLLAGAYRVSILEVQLANLKSPTGTYQLKDLLPLPFDARLL